MTNQEILLKFGEMTRSELRTAKAICDYFEREIKSLKEQIGRNPCDTCQPPYSTHCEDCPNNTE
jgi:hypothetical protein